MGQLEGAYEDIIGQYLFFGKESGAASISGTNWKSADCHHCIVARIGVQIVHP